MFVRISRGDRLPTVALAQARLVMDGANLDVDGAFGPRTEDAVIEFQRRHHLAETGNVDPGTWHVLGAARELVAVDHIDAADLAVLAEDRPHLDDGHSNIHVLSASETRGVRVAIESIVARHGARSVSLLRFHGHGGPGHMVVASGRYGDYPNTFAGEYFRAPTAATLELFARLGSIMKPYGSIELHGCRPGERQYSGSPPSRCHMPWSDRHRRDRRALARPRTQSGCSSPCVPRALDDASAPASDSDGPDGVGATKAPSAAIVWGGAARGVATARAGGTDRSTASDRSRAQPPIASARTTVPTRPTDLAPSAMERCMFSVASDSEFTRTPSPRGALPSPAITSRRRTSSMRSLL